MKTLKFFLLSIMMLMVATVSNAQSANNDFFVGKWEFEVTGMPDGDATMTLTLTRNDKGELIGNIKQSADDPSIELSRVDEKKGKSITAYFKANGYDCYIYAEKTGDDTVEGSVMDMFDATGKRIKDNK